MPDSPRDLKTAQGHQQFRFWGKKNHPIRKLLQMPILASLLVFTLVLGYGRAIPIALSFLILLGLPLAYAYLMLRSKNKEVQEYSRLHPTLFLMEERDLKWSRYMQYPIAVMAAEVFVASDLGIKVPLIVSLLAAYATLFAVSSIFMFLLFSFIQTESRISAIACLRTVFDQEAKSPGAWLDESITYLNKIDMSHGMNLRLREDLSLRVAVLDNPQASGPILGTLIRQLEEKDDGASLKSIGELVGKPQSEILEKVSVRSEILGVLEKAAPYAGFIYAALQFLYSLHHP